jgi:hypothetical protein
MTALSVVAVLSVVALVSAAHAQPSADQVLTDAGLSGDDKQNVLAGQFVNVSVSGVSDRDLSFGTAFLVKTPPAALARQIEAGELITADTQVQAYGELSAAGSLADFAKLTLTDDEAKTLTNAQPGESLNLSSSEIQAFQALQGSPTAAVQEQLKRMLLARYQAYRASGLAGIAPYDRGGKTGELVADLRRASQATAIAQKYLPAFYAMLLGYPKAKVPGMQERFFWSKSLIHDQMTYVLAHVVAVADGAGRAVMRREFYVSTGYNGEQTAAGFLPVKEGTVVLSVVHAFTDQVTGFGGSFKRSIGSKVMASKMRELYQAERDKSQGLK